MPALTSGGRTISERSLLPRDSPYGVANRYSALFSYTLLAREGGDLHFQSPTVQGGESAYSCSPELGRGALLDSCAGEADA